MKIVYITDYAGCLWWTSCSCVFIGELQLP